ncbi:MAG: 1-acyl-sn-glycerol-3-phosphate acyltransferase [Lentisphaerae bacterium]|nr:1-acyl-sn-glycerol-3-phosphate acyltransferase [Lentisphaerota bacterium]
MNSLEYIDNIYNTQLIKQPHFTARLCPALFFYPKFSRIIWNSSKVARQKKYGYAEWANSSIDIMKALESVGVHLEITGIENLANLDTPCVIIGNHMSMLETMALPGIVQPVKTVTFVVKESLLTYPVFSHIMRSRNPIAVTRDNPREDFKAVMEGGKERLANGISIIVFPQTTRAKSFDPNEFNSIGIKLAQRAKVPVVPLALKTDAWENGLLFKDFGRIVPKRKVHFSFGVPITIDGNASGVHQQVIDFIENRLETWSEQKD